MLKSESCQFECVIACPSCNFTVQEKCESLNKDKQEEETLCWSEPEQFAASVAVPVGGLTERRRTHQPSNILSTSGRVVRSGSFQGCLSPPPTIPITTLQPLP